MTSQKSMAYAPYGHHPQQQIVLGFNGGPRDPATGHYPLGNGYRAFMPTLMRFNSPDSMSPFSNGGLNAYAYVLGDPINRQDPSGHVPAFKMFAKLRERFSPSKRNLSATVYASEPGNGPVYTQTEKRFVTYGNIPRKYKMNVVEQTDRVPSGYELIGFHGSREKYTQSLEAGLDASYLKRQLVGGGFYATPSYRHADKYAGSEGRIFGVYAKGVERWRPNVQFDRPAADIIVIRPASFQNVIVRSDIRMPLRHLHPLPGDSV